MSRRTLALRLSRREHLWRDALRGSSTISLCGHERIDDLQSSRREKHTTRTSETRGHVDAIGHRDEIRTTVRSLVGHRRRRRSDESRNDRCAYFCFYFCFLRQQFRGGESISTRSILYCIIRDTNIYITVCGAMRTKTVDIESAL